MRIRLWLALALASVLACGTSERSTDEGDTSDAATSDVAGDASAGGEDADEDGSEGPDTGGEDAETDALPDTDPPDGDRPDVDRPDIDVPDIGDPGECVPGEFRPYECPDGMLVEWCTCDESGTWLCVRTPQNQCVDPCGDGSPLVCDMEEPLCETGTWATVRDGCWECIDPATCGDGVAPCDSDLLCLGSQVCDECYTSSCPDCDDCVGRCVSHGCPSEEIIFCNALRPECGPGAVSVVRDGCWICVDADTCDVGPPEPTEGCTTNSECGVSGYCAPCPDGSDTCERRCEASGCVSGDERDVACLLPTPVCTGDEVLIVRGGCWSCESRLTCERFGDLCDRDDECPAGGWCGCPTDDCFAPFCVDTGCSPEPFVSCRALRPECGASEVAIAVDGCWECVDRSTCGEREGSCDDGSAVVCDSLPLTCEFGSVLAVQNGCYECVNPLTCLAWGEAGCRSDADCPEGEYCDDCGTGSCPVCEDCVAACRSRG